MQKLSADIAANFQVYYQKVLRFIKETSEKSEDKDTDEENILNFVTF